MCQPPPPFSRAVEKKRAAEQARSRDDGCSVGGGESGGARGAGANGRVGGREMLEGMDGLESGEPLWVPYTQEAVPLTDELLEKQQEGC